MQACRFMCVVVWAGQGQVKVKSVRKVRGVPQGQIGREDSAA